MAADDQLTLAAEFPPASREQWLSLVDKVLGGKAFDQALVSRTYDGLRIEPLYTAADAPALTELPGAGRRTRSARAAGAVVEGWEIRQRHGDPDLAQLNAAILEDLAGGAGAIWLDVERSGIASFEALDRALEGVALDLAPIVLQAGDRFAAAADSLLALWEHRAVPRSAALGGFGADPLGALARAGRLAAPLEQRLAEAARLAAKAPPQLPVLAVDATPYADAAAPEGYELGCLLATAAAYLRALVEHGHGIDAACSRLELRLSVNADQFLGIAKLRAARRLFSRMAEVCGASEASRGVRVHAVTAAAMYSQRDPAVNILRAALAAFAAAVGGADAITVSPFDHALGQADPFSRRIARNTQVILREESHLDQVIDPGGGSWHLEALTQALAEEGWRRFQELEAAGGMAAALTSGLVGAHLEAAWGERLANLARRRDPLTGVSEFPDIAEPAPRRRPVPDPAASADPAAVSAPAPLPLRRLAAPFERLRDAADASAVRPRVFLANLGPPAVHGARAGFAKNLFEVAGIETLGNDGFDSAEAAAAAFSASGAPAACICSSDARYASDAEAASRALKAAGCARLYLAGAPGERRAALEAAGVDEFIFLGCDLLDVLERALAHLGAAV